MVCENTIIGFFRQKERERDKEMPFKWYLNLIIEKYSTQIIISLFFLMKPKITPINGAKNREKTY